MSDIAQALLDEKLIAINVSSVAQVCKASADTVQSIMMSIRDEIVESIFQRKHSVSLNFGVGTLQLQSNGSCQFTSSFANETVEKHEADRVKECDLDKGNKLTEDGLKNLPRDKAAERYAEERSKQSVAERSIKYMQQR